MKTDDPTVSTPVKNDLSTAASELTRPGGPRREAYGEPLEEFARVGVMWSALLEPWFYQNFNPNRPMGSKLEPIPPELVGILMVALKLGRETFRHKLDNLKDAVGYLQCVDDIHTVRDHRTVKFSAATSE